jgi:hypothetical protein
MYILIYLFDSKEITAEDELPTTLDECVEQIYQDRVFVRAFEIDGDKCFAATQHVLEALINNYCDGEKRVPLTRYLAPTHHDRAERVQDDIDDELRELARYGTMEEQASRDYYDGRR